jgi:ABC-type multidrug transport system fused ATPase/permease subunit
MAKKHIVTNVEIEKDIISALKNPPKQSKESYKKGMFPAIIFAVLFFVMVFILDFFVLWFLLGLVVLAIVSSIFYYFRLKNQIKNVKINDYDITTETVSSTDEEHYMRRANRRSMHIDSRSMHIDNYSIRFENGKTWRVPKELYCWKEGIRMIDYNIHQTTHRGDVMIVVTKKDTGKIVVAYHTDIFEYKN